MIRLTAVALVGAVAVASCGLPTDDSFEQIPAEDLPLSLSQTTTTTTTTTAPSPTTAPPPMTSQEPPTTLVSTEPVEVFFVLRRNTLQRQLLHLNAPVTEAQVIARLEQGPVNVPDSVELRTAVVPGLVARADESRGVVTVDLDSETLRRMTPTEGRLAIAQLVLTLTRLPGIGRVTFTLDGEPQEIPVPARGGELSAPGEELAFADFEVMLSTTPPSTTTTTTSTTTTTAPPPVDTEPPPVDTTAPPG